MQTKAFIYSLVSLFEVFSQFFMHGSTKNRFEAQFKVFISFFSEAQFEDQFEANSFDERNK